MNIINNLSEETMEELDTYILTFEKLDEIFEKKLPKDIVKIIYDMIEPVCNSCENCCMICSIYCYFFNCLRFESGRDVCNTPEYNRELHRYLLPPSDNNGNDEEKTSLLS